METGRDDFVIAIRSAFLKKGTKQRFSLLGLILFSMIFLILGSFNFKAIDYVKIIIKEIVYRSSFIISEPENLLKENILYVKSHMALYNQNIKNKEELKTLRSKNLTNQIMILENSKYKKLIDEYFIKDDEIYAKVLIDKQSPFLRSIILNKGSKHNIKLGMIVIDSIFLVGKVVEVNYLSSRVLLLPDLNSKIPVLLQPGDTQAIMSGDGNKNGTLQYIKNKNLKIKDEEIMIITSGAGGLFKSGIPIGKISKKSLIDNEIVIDFNIDFSQLKYVKVTNFIKEKGVLDKSSKKGLKKINNQIDVLKRQKENLRILLEQKKISDEIRVKIQEENNVLKNKTGKLENELFGLKEDFKKLTLNIEDIEFKELDYLYRKKCKKTFYNNLYKVGTTQYKNCILNQDKIKN